MRRFEAVQGKLVTYQQEKLLVLLGMIFVVLTVIH